MPKQCIDHKGNTYKSIVEMCRAYGITDTCYKFRIKYLGFSQKDALEKPMQDKTVKDHLGNTYKNTAEMAKAYGLNSNALKHRLRSGWTIEKALTTPLKNTKSHVRAERMHRAKVFEPVKSIVYDHRGVYYSSIQEMCNRYNASVTKYLDCIAANESIEEALKVGDFHSNNFKLTGDELERTLLNATITKRDVYRCIVGNKFKTKTDMLVYYGVSNYAFVKRLDKNKSVAYALGMCGDTLIERVLNTKIVNPYLKVIGITDNKQLVCVDANRMQYTLNVYEAIAFGNVRVCDAINNMLNAQGYGIEALKRAKGLI